MRYHLVMLLFQVVRHPMAERKRGAHDGRPSAEVVTDQRITMR